MRDGSLDSHGFGDDCGHSFGTYGSVDRRSKRKKISVLFAVQFEKTFRTIRHERRPRQGASYSGPSSFLLLRRATNIVPVAPTQVDSGRFSALDEDLSGTDVVEGGGESLSLLANIDESSNFGRVPSEVIAMSDAEGPSRRLVMVSRQEVTPTVIDLPSVVSGESHAPSEAESDVESVPVFNHDNTHNEHSSPVEENMTIVDFTFGAAGRAALQGLNDIDLEAACVMKSPPAFRGHYRSAMRFALSESDRGTDRNDPVRAPTELGSCSCCSLICCSTAEHVEATFRRVV